MAFRRDGAGVASLKHGGGMTSNRDWRFLYMYLSVQSFLRTEPKAKSTIVRVSTEPKRHDNQPIFLLLVHVSFGLVSRICGQVLFIKSEPALFWNQNEYLIHIQTHTQSKRVCQHTFGFMLWLCYYSVIIFIQHLCFKQLKVDCHDKFLAKANEGFYVWLWVSHISFLYSSLFFGKAVVCVSSELKRFTSSFPAKNFSRIYNPFVAKTNK